MNVTWYEFALAVAVFVAVSYVLNLIVIRWAFTMLSKENQRWLAIILAIAFNVLGIVLSNI